MDIITEQFRTEYARRFVRSRQLTESAREFMPGGETRAGIWFAPYPLWIERAEECRIIDVDGNEYLDFHNNYSSAILGHSNPRIVAAAQHQAQAGTSLGGLTPAVIRWAELLCVRLKSAEKVRFATSGTEAVMTAVRLARAFTGKDLIVKTAGSYHGAYDPVLYPSDSAGTPKSVQQDSIVVPFNNLELLRDVLTRRGYQIAAVVVEATLGTNGMIPPEDRYLESVRELTSDVGVLLILDEIITFRLSLGGLQQLKGIDADLTTLGKFIGGGYPVGAVAGREEIMQLLSPEIRRLHHSGTFVAHPVAAAAGVATLEQLTAEQIAELNCLGEALRTGLLEIVHRIGVRAHVTGLGSLQNLHFSIERPRDYDTAASTNTELLSLFHLRMLEKGIYLPARGLFALSTPMSQVEIHRALKATEETLMELKPIIDEAWPEFTQ